MRQLADQRRRLTPLAACALLFVGACRNDDASSVESERSAAPCSAGPVYLDAGQLPIDTADAKTYPACTTHCHGKYRQLDGIPAGACSVSEGEACTAPLDVSCTCGGAKTLATSHVLKCDCHEGQWRCVIAIPGSSVCPCAGG